MITRFQTVTCPKCGHIGKPKVAGEPGALISAVPIVGDVAFIAGRATSTLRCAKCGEPFTESVATKARATASSAASSITGLYQGLKQHLNTPLRICAGCKAEVSDTANFCGKCGAAL